MTARTDSFEGLHVLLVTEDDARAQAIAKSLRERKAHVGDVRAGAKDPVALRGADLLVIDARRAAATEARVAEVRSDVRARWASVATIDYASLAGDDGTVDLRVLEGIVSRLAGMDKALTERARAESSFETMLAPLGPTRTLRALALAGPTLHVELDDGTLKASVDLADELLVAAFAERAGQRSEAWSALARALGMTDATVRVARRAHPTAMNIMEPVDQALENAAQERARTPEVYSAEERVEELSGLRREPREQRAQESIASSAFAARDSSPHASVSTKSVAPRARTLIGVAPVAAPAAQASAPLRDRFADVPTDPAAPGLLQRMAREPANDALIPELKAAPSNAPTSDPTSNDRPTAPPPPLAHSAHAEEEFEGDGQEFDAGEVTVVADQSQLDILRETLGRIDAQPKSAQSEQPTKPLTSTMPAPKGPETDELENVENPNDEPVLELSVAAKSAAQKVFGDDEEGDTFPSETPVETMPDKTALAAPRTPNLELGKKPVAKRSSQGWLVAAVLVAAAAALAAFYGVRSGMFSSKQSSATHSAP